VSSRDPHSQNRAFSNYLCNPSSAIYCYLLLYQSWVDFVSMEWARQLFAFRFLYCRFEGTKEGLNRRRWAFSELDMPGSGSPLMLYMLFLYYGPKDGFDCSAITSKPF
jgi:hypothetical protein